MSTYEEHEDRTTVIRKLLIGAIGNYKQDRVLRKYEQGKISISRAAEETGLTVGEIEEYMVRKGYRSIYSTVDMGRELELLKSFGQSVHYILQKGDRAGAYLRAKQFFENMSGVDLIYSGASEKVKRFHHLFIYSMHCLN